MENAERARTLVARWEHGDEKHHQWLRDVAIPDLEAAFAAIRRQTLVEVAHIVSAPQGVAVECLNGMSAQFRSGHATARKEAAAAILAMEDNSLIVLVYPNNERAVIAVSNALLYNGIGDEAECDSLAPDVLKTLKEVVND